MNDKAKRGIRSEGCGCKSHLPKGEPIGGSTTVVSIRNRIRIIAAKNGSGPIQDVGRSHFPYSRSQIILRTYLRQHRRLTRQRTLQTRHMRRFGIRIKRMITAIPAPDTPEARPIPAIIHDQQPPVTIRIRTLQQRTPTATSQTSQADRTNITRERFKPGMRNVRTIPRPQQVAVPANIRRVGLQPILSQHYGSHFKRRIEILNPISQHVTFEPDAPRRIPSR